MCKKYNRECDGCGSCMEDEKYIEDMESEEFEEELNE